MTRYVAGFAFDQGSVLLIEKKRPEWQAGKLNGVGGKIENGEVPIEAMMREFAEETGKRTEEREWSLFAILKGLHFEVWFFRADMATFVPMPGTDELPVWVGVDRIDTHRMIVPNLRWLVPMAGEEQRKTWPFVIGERCESITGRRE
jgi:8-oxo-dGTP diphosphatase